MHLARTVDNTGHKKEEKVLNKQTKKTASEYYKARDDEPDCEPGQTNQTKDSLDESGPLFVCLGLEK